MRNIVFSKYLLLSALFCLVACSNHVPEYKKKLDVRTGPVPQLVFDRYEEVLFNLDTSQFQQELMKIQSAYRPFLSGDLNDPDAIRYLKDFVEDSLSVHLYRKVKNAFPDLTGVRDLMGAVYQHFNYYYPEIQLPIHVYTCVSGVDPESPAVMLFDDAVVISLDWYLNGDAIYERIGMPKYRAQRTTDLGIAKDLAQELYETYIRQGRKQTNLLEEMIDAGKMYYFIEAMYPSISDEVLLGYTSEQLQWAEENEGNLWADIVGNQGLYASDFELFRTFFADGPFTNEYSHDAPPRLGEFLGLHIVRAYMGSHDVSLQELINNKDLLEIFQESGYKPKK
jgi:hypothetical protein